MNDVVRTCTRTGYSWRYCLRVDVYDGVAEVSSASLSVFGRLLSLSMIGCARER